MITLSIDFETRSTVDLRRTGVYPYATDPSTDIWCMAYAFGDEDPQLWVPGSPNVPDPRIKEHVESGGPLRAWNAQFERLIWACILHRRYGAPLPSREQWYCTAADAAALALPRALNRAALALGLDEEKDDEGYRLMLQMSKPRTVKDDGTVVWWDDKTKLRRLYAYCLQDVRVERAVFKRIRPLGPQERRVYLMDQRMNDRGVGVDVELARAAQEIVDEGMERANAELLALTEGEVDRITKPTAIRRWLNSQTHLELDNLRKDTVRDLLDGDDDLPEDVTRVLELRQESAKSSNAKISSMLEYAQFDGRAHGMLLYHGAGTGRWSGRGPQPHNYPRPEIEDPESYIDKVLARDFDGIAENEPPLIVISSLLRSIFNAAPGHRFLSGDFSQIEARVLAWLAEQEDLLELFRQGGKVYEDMASFIYGTPIEEITKDSVERQIGKNSVLGAGFQMGADTFALQVKIQTGIDLPRGERDEDGALLPGEVDEAQRAIDGYRAKNHRIKAFWGEIDNAAKQAVAEPGIVTQVGRGGCIQYTYRGQFLWCILPSGRPLAYALPRIQRHIVRPKGGEPFETTAVSYMGVDSYTRKWKRQFSYGGKWTENVVQATARDLMAEAMLRLEAAGYPQVLTVHDEAVAEVPEGGGSLEEFLSIMQQVPVWADGLPVAVEGWEGERYRK